MMNRRKFMWTVGAGAGALASSAGAGAEGTPTKTFPTPTPAQYAWQEAELGIIFHYDLHLFDDKRYNQRKNRLTDFGDPNIFNPAELDTDQWVAAAKACGARFALITASHETGFRLWQSDVNPYCLKAVAWGGGKRDIVAEFVESCRKAGIAPGVYMGTRWNGHLGVLDFKVTERSPLSQQEYKRLIEGEVEEICSRYGDLFELWFDGGAYSPSLGGPDVLPIFDRYQPNCLFYHSHERADARWGGSESGTVPYPCWATMPFDGYMGHANQVSDFMELLKHGDPRGAFWCPAMSDAPLRNHEWFWEPNDEHKLYSLEALQNMYYKSVGHNSTLIVGATPDRRGLVPDADMTRLNEWGDWIRKHFAHPRGETSGRGNVLELCLPAPKRVDMMILQEDIREGERVRAYTVEYLDGDTWRLLAEGSCIGHKRIAMFDAVEAERIRLIISKSIGEPYIRKLAIYETG
ncbi:MAG: alpha-L-fucosidase [Candidatus Hydrogenedentota bacterium]